MDADDLIRNIVREVLNQLRGTTEKACVLVLAERDEVLASEVRQLAGEDSDVLFFGEDIGKRVPERYILPNLCCAAMADLAGGRASGKFLTEVLRLLLTGQKVEVLHFGYTAYAETAPGPLYELYTSHRKTLETYGVSEFRKKRPDTFVFREYLVTEEVVGRAHGDGASTLAVPAEAIITPLAAETARNLDINIMKRS